MNKEPILIIGSKGQLGKEISKHFKKNNVNFYCIFKKKKLIKEILSKILSKKIKIIINCIAYTNVEKAEIEKKKCLYLNYIFLKKITEICKKESVTLIHFSTDYVYAGKKRIYYEDSLCRPLNFYGYSKMLGDHEIYKKKINYFIFRTSWLLSNNKKSIIYKLYKKILNEKVVNVIYDNYGQPTSTRFVANFITSNIKKFNDSNLSGIYHLTNIGYTSFFLLAKEIKKNLKKKELAIIKKISYKKYPMKAKRPIFSKLSLNKTIRLFNFNKITWKQEVKNIINKL